MVRPCFQIDLPSPRKTAELAAMIGSLLRPGDVLLLEGEIGAGKTHFARSLIQSLMDTPEDVPSPTFTLVQTYDTATGEIWHSDLYRLTDVSEVMELGLDEAMEHAICLIEWPDRLGPDTPDTALHLRFDTLSDSARRITLSWAQGDWDDRLAPLKTERAHG